MKRWIWPLVVVASGGLVASVGINVAVRRGMLANLGPWEPVLYVGCFLVGFTGFYVTGLHDKSKTLDEYWALMRAVFMSCPQWLRCAVALSWIFGFVSAATSMNLSFTALPDPDAARHLIGLSGGWMMLYSMSLTMLYSAATGRPEA